VVKPDQKALPTSHLFSCTPSEHDRAAFFRSALLASPHLTGDTTGLIDGDEMAGESRRARGLVIFTSVFSIRPPLWLDHAHEAQSPRSLDIQRQHCCTQNLYLTSVPAPCSILQNTPPGRHRGDREFSPSGNTLTLTAWQRLTSRQVVLHHQKLGKRGIGPKQVLDACEQRQRAKTATLSCTVNQNRSHRSTQK